MEFTTFYVDHAHTFYFCKLYIEDWLSWREQKSLVNISKNCKDKNLIKWKFDTLNDTNIFSKNIIRKKA